MLQWITGFENYLNKRLCSSSALIRRKILQELKITQHVIIIFESLGTCDLFVYWTDSERLNRNTSDCNNHILNVVLKLAPQNSRIWSSDISLVAKLEPGTYINVLLFPVRSSFNSEEWIHNWIMCSTSQDYIS